MELVLTPDTFELSDDALVYVDGRVAQANAAEGQFATVRVSADGNLQMRDGARIGTVLLELSGGYDGQPARGARERQLRQHVGDYTMFMSGIFRTYAEREGFLGYFLQEGPRAYRETARLTRAMLLPEAGRFEALAAQFEQLSGALDYTRKVHFHSAARTDGLAELVRRFDLFN